MYCDWPRLGKCCFCLPLRKGVIAFSYVNLIFSIFMIGLASYTLHHEEPVFLMYSRMLNIPTELNIAIYSVEVLFNIVLIYGAHVKSATPLKIYFYFALISSLVIAVLHIIYLLGGNFRSNTVVDMVVFICTGFFIQLYLIICVKSLLMKFKTEGLYLYDNDHHLDQIEAGETNIERKEVNFCDLSVPKNKT